MFRESSSSCGLGLGNEFDVSFPDDPGDASELVGESDGGLVVTASSLDFESPGPEAVGGFHALGSPKNGAGAVGEEHSDIGVAALADATEPADASGGVFSRKLQASMITVPFSRFAKNSKNFARATR
jgi:hypothetical protein